MTCALCDQPAPTYTLCDEHRDVLGVSIRRDRPHHSRPTMLPPPGDRAPRGAQLAATHIQDMRRAYEDHTLAELAAQVDVSTFTISRIIRGVPGDSIHPATAHKLDVWADTHNP